MRANRDLYLCPWIAAIEPLGYAWDGFDEVWLWASDRRFAPIDLWYRVNRPAINRAGYPNYLELYWPSPPEPPVASVIAADCHTPDSIDNLAAYLGSERLTRMRDRGFRTLGAVFLHAPAPAL